MATLSGMRWFKRERKEPERFYLLPGQGGRARHRKRRMMILWSLAVGLPVAVIVAVTIYWLNQPVRP